ncbi:MAG: sulfatase-like hydrolase/transferase [Actinomycetota bacterium]|nr:sulfatase-like hydrolase/transferase [Actinomycetota bacterium]
MSHAQPRCGHSIDLRRLVAMLIVAAAAVITPTSNAHATTPTKPNIVIIMSDDQRWDTMNDRYMPNLTQLLAPNGVRLDQAFVSNPLCCPSRVSTLTGRYSYTTGVYGNRGMWGGYGAARRFDATTDTIATTLQADGYVTGLVGKYLNGYEPAIDYRTIPPGWDSWFEVRTAAYYNYAAAVDGVSVQTYGSAPEDYSTRVLADRALSFINAQAGGPFFLYFAPTAPHGPAIADPDDAGMFDADLASYGRPPSEQEADVSDKPAYVQERAPSATTQAYYDDFYARQLAATYGVDRAIGEIWQALPDNTVVLFMSDNGYEWGEHRRIGKIVPYNESIRVPMLIASKSVDLSAIGPVGGSTDRLALNVDVRPTLESFVGDFPQAILDRRRSLDEIGCTTGLPDHALDEQGIDPGLLRCSVTELDVRQVRRWLRGGVRRTARSLRAEQHLGDRPCEPAAPGSPR